MNKQTFRQWLKANLSEYLRDLAEYGAGAGFPHLTYYCDTNKLYDRFEDEIYSNLREDSESFGYDNVEQFVSTFNRYDMLEFPEGRKQLLVWYLAEKYSREIVEGR